MVFVATFVHKEDNTELNKIITHTLKKKDKV